MTQGSHKFVTSHHGVQMETVLFSLPTIVALPAIVAFEIENFLPSCDRSDLCVSLSIDRGLPFNLKHLGKI